MKIKAENKADVRILFMDTVEELGNLVKKKLIRKYGLKDDNFIEADMTRFGNGEGKVKLLQTVRKKRLYIVTDMGNSSLTYMAYGKKHIKMPDEHFSDLKRIITAANGNASEITVIQTILYASRQHKKHGRESLDCAMGLQELEDMKVNCITTFDAHNIDVRQAIPLTPFDNIIPTAPMLSSFVENENINYDNLIAISPDSGAMGRTRFYSGMLECDIGMFYKRRDYSKIDEFGKNPIADHAYLGKEVDDGEYLIVDDMISGGGTIIEILEKLMVRKPKNVWVMATFALFTEGTAKFDEAYEKGWLTRVYCTNFTDMPEEIRNKPWLKRVDCSDLLAECLVTYINDDAISPLLNGRAELFRKIAEMRK